MLIRRKLASKAASESTETNSMHLRHIRSAWAASTSWRRLWNHPKEGASRQIQKNSTRRKLSLPLFCLYQTCLRMEANGVTPVQMRSRDGDDNELTNTTNQYQHR